MSAGWVHLRCGEGVLRVDESIAAMSTPRVFVDAFRTAPATPLLTVERRARVEGEEVSGPLGTCRLQLGPEGLVVEVGDGPFLGELVLRLAWYVATVRAGGLLIHASALRRGEVALVASGQSGDGKSTLARLGVGAGLTLMTDEVVQLFADGRVGGTPFRSDPDNVGAPGLARARWFVGLEKAQEEVVRPLAPLAAAQLVLSQCFEVELGLLPAVERRRRALAFLAATRLGTLAFRKHPDAGRFVAGLLAAGAGEPGGA